MIEPPVWTREELSEDAAKSLAAFRDNRVAETAQWTTTFDWHHKEFIRLLNEIGPRDPAKLWPAQVADIFAKKLGNAFRYLAGPPMSAEDLRLLAGASLAPGRLARDPEAARRVLETIRQRLDDRRFPWIADKRPPTGIERQAAVMASAAMMTVQTLATGRRILKEAAQEKAIRDFLVSLGYREAAARRIVYLEQAPAPGQFCARCMVGTRKADIAVRLFDERLMAIECEVSNNFANGHKHINKDATAKAQSWYKRFGMGVIVPTAVLSGVFDVEILLQTQSTPLTLFWSHDLSPLRDFVAESRH
jgi:XamI restriction endonuclease